MKLADRLNYILAPIILGVFLALSFITYFTFKEQTINSLTSQLAYDIDLINQSINQEIYSSDTLLRQHLDSKEALAFFNTQNQSFAKASYEAQLISRFVKMKANADFIDTIGIFNLQKEPEIYINLNDPFASAKVSIKALEILQKIEQAISTKSRIRFPALQASLIKNANNQYQLQVIRLFSPHLLSSEKVYIANKSLRLIQLVNSTSSFVKHHSKLAEKYQNNTIISYKPNENFLNAANNKAKTTFNNKGDIVVTLNNKVTEINITLKSEFIDHELMNIIKVISFVLAVVSFISYFSLSWLINKQVIKPITKLAGDIENIDISENTQLTYLTEKDEISELTNRYFSLVNRVNQLAHKDPLTGLLNRTSFNHALKKALLSSHHSSKLVALLYFDLDNFKQVNDNFGHSTGDKVLKKFSEHLLKSVRNNDRIHYSSSSHEIARLGGDEFVMLLVDMPSEEAIEGIAKRLLTLFSHGFKLGERTYNIQASIGIAISSMANIEPDVLLTQADSAMYQAKQQGKNCYRLYSEELYTQIQETNQIEFLIKKALKKQDFYLVYMPVYCAQNLNLTGMEVLLRTNELQSNGVGPATFIPIAETSNLIFQIDLWVIEEAFARLNTLLSTTNFHGSFAINISTRELLNKDFPEKVSALIDKYNTPTNLIEFEITETYLPSNHEQAMSILMALKALGITLTLDDFGTGYTSFKQLTTYPVDILKVDRTFVKSFNQPEKGKKSTLDIINKLAKLYHLEVNIEGVENKAELLHIQNIGCDKVQGFYLSTPLKWEYLPSFIEKNMGSKMP